MLRSSFLDYTKKSYSSPSDIGHSQQTKCFKRPYSEIFLTRNTHVCAITQNWSAKMVGENVLLWVKWNLTFLFCVICLSKKSEDKNVNQSFICQDRNIQSDQPHTHFTESLSEWAGSHIASEKYKTKFLLHLMRLMHTCIIFHISMMPFIFFNSIMVQTYRTYICKGSFWNTCLLSGTSRLDNFSVIKKIKKQAR